MAAHLIGKLAAPVRVPREHDFGIDFFCQLYSTGGAKSVGSDELFAVQVKGGSEALHYGGLRDEQWRNYEITWLRYQSVPLFLARVRENPSTLELYSLGPVWRVLWQSAEPFKIECVSVPESATALELAEVEPEKENCVHGDGTCWSVPLGPPILCLTDALLGYQSFIENAKYVLRRQIGIERRNLVNFLLGVAIHERLAGWATNDFVSQATYNRAMYWDMTPGKNIGALAAVVAPAVVSLGTHLQWQNDRDAYRLIDILDWLQTKGALDGIGEKLLKELRTNRDINVGPAPGDHNAK